MEKKDLVEGMRLYIYKFTGHRTKRIKRYIE